MLPWVLCGICGVLCLVLGAKLWSVHAGIRAVCADLERYFSQETNTLLSVSGGGRHVKKLAATLNRELRQLRKERRRYINGDQELKHAVTNISHDLRTPLTAICGYLDLLEREPVSDNAARYLALITNRALALKQLTEEMFRYSVTLSAGEAPELADVDLGSVLEESLASFYAALTARGISPVVDVCEARITRKLNATALSRVFGNLLNNALKYSDGDLCVSLRQDGTVVFANKAARLDAMQVGRLFDRFFSVETASDATGLGLFIAKSLVEQMHGSIAARYADETLYVTVSFPAAETLKR